MDTVVEIEYLSRYIDSLDTQTMTSFNKPTASSKRDAVFLRLYTREHPEDPN